MDHYYHHLLKDPAALRNLFKRLLIPLTSFFRNPELYAVLKDEILPSILSEAAERGTIRIWVPGCSTGEEVYTIAICLAEELNHFDNSIDIRIFGTDVNEDAIEEAYKGIYSIERLKGVSSQRLKRFFEKINGEYKASNLIRNLCIFAKQNLLKDPPLNHVDIISCQNVLIYFASAAQKLVLDSFRFALNPEGFLILGESEAISFCQSGFKKWKEGYTIYTRYLCT